MHYKLKGMTAVGLTTLALASASIGQPATEKSLQLEAKIPLGNVAGRIDHMAIDLETLAFCTIHGNIPEKSCRPARHSTLLALPRFLSQLSRKR